MHLCDLSRQVNHRLTGRNEMICTTAELRRWPIRHALNVILWPRDWWIYGETRLGHCERAARWEASQARPENDFIDTARRDGLI